MGAVDGHVLHDQVALGDELVLLETHRSEVTVNRLQDLPQTLPPPARRRRG